MDGFLRQMTHTHTQRRMFRRFSSGGPSNIVDVPIKRRGWQFFFFNFPIGDIVEMIFGCSLKCFYSYLFILLFEAVAALPSFVYWMPQEMSPGAWLDVIVGDDGSRASTFDLLFGAAVLKIFFLENRALKNTYYIMMCVCVCALVCTSIVKRRRIDRRRLIKKWFSFLFQGLMDIRAVTAIFQSS
jgi:hypothetical protein